jgi:hypothetical protein
MADKYTYRMDIRPGGNGSPIAYKYATPGSGGDIEQGELVAWTATTKLLVRFGRAGNFGKFVGITRDSAKAMAKLGNQPALALSEMSVFSTGVHLMTGSPGDTYEHGNPVYMALNNSTQQVTKLQSTGGIQIGTVHLPQGGSVVGAADVPILIDEFTVVQT